MGMIGHIIGADREERPADPAARAGEEELMVLTNGVRMLVSNVELKGWTKVGMLKEVWPGVSAPPVEIWI